MFDDQLGADEQKKISPKINPKSTHGRPPKMAKRHPHWGDVKPSCLIYSKKNPRIHAGSKPEIDSLHIESTKNVQQKKGWFLPRDSAPGILRQWEINSQFTSVTPVVSLEWRFYLGYALCPLILPLLSTIYGEVGQ